MNFHDSVSQLVQVGQRLRSSLMRTFFPAILPRLQTKAMAAVTEASLKPAERFANYATALNETYKAVLRPEGKK